MSPNFRLADFSEVDVPRSTLLTGIFRRSVLVLILNGCSTSRVVSNEIFKSNLI